MKAGPRGPCNLYRIEIEFLIRNFLMLEVPCIGRTIPVFTERNL